MKFYSKSIDSFQDWQDYLNAKGYKFFIASEIPGDGYFAEMRKGDAKLKDFTQIGLSKASQQDTPGEGADIFPEKYEWVRLSFKDCSNSSILNS